jgi:hypothetical protein
MIRGIFQAAPILMIEVRKEQEPILQRLCSEFSDVNYAISLLGREPVASTPFHVSERASERVKEKYYWRDACSMTLISARAISSSISGVK